jgi:hypothetical protein
MISKYSVALGGTAGETFTIPVTNVVQEFSLAQMQNTNGVMPIACVITCEDQITRYAFNVDPQGGIPGFGALGHILSPNDEIILRNTNTITNFRFIMAEKFDAGDLQITMYYEIGA